MNTMGVVLGLASFFVLTSDPCAARCRQTAKASEGSIECKGVSAQDCKRLKGAMKSMKGGEECIKSCKKAMKYKKER